MPAKANLVLIDGDGASHTFTPDGVVGSNRNTHKWRKANADGVPIGDHTITFTKQSMPDGSSRFSTVLYRPEVALVGGAYVVVRSTKKRTITDVTEQSLTDDRDDTMVLDSNLSLSAVRTAIANNEDFW